LKHFGIPESSQVMVFSKTSKQNDLIGPTTPRVIYLVMMHTSCYSVGGAMEVSTIDPKLGPDFLSGRSRRSAGAAPEIRA